MLQQSLTSHQKFLMKSEENFKCNEFLIKLKQVITVEIFKRLITFNILYA